MFVWYYNSLIKSKPKKIIKTNSKSTKYWRIKMKRKTTQKDKIQREKKWKEFFKGKKKQCKSWFYITWLIWWVQTQFEQSVKACFDF